MKALILAGGKGSRLRDQPDAPPKPLLQVGSKRLMDFSLQNAAAAGVDEIIVVVSYFTEAVINHYGSSYRGVPITYKIQNEPRGLVHAIECSAGAMGSSDFILLLADEVFITANLSAMVDRFHDENLFAILGVVKVEGSTRDFQDLFDPRGQRDGPDSPPDREAAPAARRHQRNRELRVLERDPLVHRRVPGQPGARREGAPGPDPVRHR